MKQNNRIKGRPRSAPARKMIGGLLVFLLGMLLILVNAGNVSAEAVFDGYTGPVWLNPGYGFTVNLTTLSNPEKYIGLSYTVNAGAETCVECTCTEPDCTDKIGDWVCTIPSSYPDATITWDISAYPNVLCGGTKTTGYTGSFFTGPTAAGVRMLTANKAESRVFQSGLTIIITISAVVVILALIWLNKRFRARSCEPGE